MPQVSSVKAFLKARQTGDTKTTKRLTQVFKKANHIDILVDVDLCVWVTTPWVMDKQLTGQVRAFLGASNALSGPELDHIDDWPKGQKEDVRGKLVDALINDQNIIFKWTVHNGDGELTDIDDPGPPGDITIKFRSPWKFVKLHTPTYAGISGITVNVNQPPIDNIVSP